jgi:hypothetical protein
MHLIDTKAEVFLFLEIDGFQLSKPLVFRLGDARGRYVRYSNVDIDILPCLA